MENREALTIFRTIQKCRHQALHTNDCGNCERCQYRLEHEQIDGAVALAISALEKQEQSNAQNVNSTHGSRPNALESLNILEQTKDDKGCVPMSLVRQAFRNILEQDRWHSGDGERLPEDYSDVLVWFEYFRYGSYNRLYQTYGIGNYSGQYDAWTVNHETGWQDLRVIAWSPLPEPYKEDTE